MYTKLSNIKKYIKLHFPNKYWSISISMPSTSSWDTFRTTVYPQWVYSSSFLLPILCFSLKIIFSCYMVNSKQISLAAPVQHNPRHETMFQIQTHNWDNVTVRYTDSTNCSCYHIYCNWPECTCVLWSDYLCDSNWCASLRWQTQK